MRYGTPAALRAALDQRLRNKSQESGISVERLRRRVMYERIVVRLDLAEPDTWVVKGGLALDVRLGGRARASMDLDLGLREDAIEGDRLHDRLIKALETDPDDDWFTFIVGPTQQLQADQAGRATWRYRVQSNLGGRQFGTLKLDVAPRVEELKSTERVPLRNALAFAGVRSRTVELIDVNRHAAEKLHAMTRTYGNQPSTRVRDLVDLVLLLENDYLDDDGCRAAIQTTFEQRGTHELPSELSGPPSAWTDTYVSLVADLDIEADSLPDAFNLIRSWWTRLDLGGN